MLDFEAFEALTFDCFGTLIDWESGILGAIRPLLETHGAPQSNPEILERYARLEPAAQKGPFRNYKTVLREVVEAFANELKFTLDADERDSLVRSFVNWQPFPDTVESLQALKTRYKLAIISNVDDDLFAATAKQLQVQFDHVFTAEQAGAYKPASQFFEFALGKLGIPRGKILHVAESLYHDIAPAGELGLASVWVNRRHDRSGPGASQPAKAQPDLMVTDLRALAVRMKLL